MPRPLATLFLLSALAAFAQSGVPSALSPAFPAEQRELPPLAQVQAASRAHRLAPLSDAETTGLPARANGRVRRFSTPLRSQVSTAAREDGSTLVQFTVSSPGAAFLRLHFTEAALGHGKLWIYPAGASREFLAANPSAADGPFTARGPHDDGDFWSRPIEGDTAIVELLLPANPAALPFKIEELVHAIPEPASTAPCQRDVNCFSDFSQIATAVGSYDVVKDGFSFVCSGSLLVTRGRTFDPYFITANHCVSTQDHARSVVVYWDFRTASCNGQVPTRSSRPSTRGARLLATAPMSGGDYALLLLDQPAPGQRTYLGWNADPIALGAETIGIHHPGSPPSNYQRITFGTREADRTTIVGGEEAPAQFYWQVLETEGRTEQGSSGSPLLNREGQVLGVLSYGPVPPPGRSYCDIQGRGGYGRFSAALPSISQFLNSDPAPGLSVSSSNFAFTVQNGVAAPASQRLDIRNSAATAASYTLSKSVPWINLSATSGSATSAAPGTVTVSINPALLTTPGVFEGTVTVTSGSLAPINVTIRATVTFNQSGAVISVIPSPVIETPPDEDGYNLFYTLRIDETAGVAARITRLVIDGVDRSSDIVPFFETDQLPPFGGLGVSLRLRLTQLPRRRRIEVSGVTLANAAPWSTALDVDFLPRPSNAVLSLVTAPREVAQSATSGNCRWRHELIVQEIAGYAVQLNRWTAGELDLSSRIAEFFGSASLPANGLLRTALCWQEVGTLPRTIPIQMAGTDANGVAVNVSGSIRMVGVTTSSSTLSTSVATFDERVEAGSDILIRRQFRINVSSPDALWSISPVIGGISKDWITVNPQRGRGSATVTVTFDPYFLEAGNYSAALLVESPTSSPQLAAVNVRLVAFNPVAGPPRITGITNGASFLTGPLAPGSWITIFGENLASTSAPGRIWTGAEIIGNRLPTALDGTAVRFNGAPAAIYFVGPTQLNVQVPDLSIDGPVTVEVDAGGATARASATIARAGPALFQVGAAAAGPLPAAVDTRGQFISMPSVVPGSRPARPGEIIALFGTGFGPTVANIPAGIVPATVSPLSNPITVRIGGARANVQFAGLVGAGLNQINVQVPELPPGNHLITIELANTAIQPNIVLPVN
jgi:uncharacterized protein (TIGR03437 family)